MKNAGFTMQERSFVVVMRAWAVVFLAAGIAFALWPDAIVNFITNAGTLLGWNAPPLKPGGERFWLVLAVAFLFVLSYLCAIVQRNLLCNIGYTRPVLFAKLASSVGFAVCFFAGERQFAYLVGAAVDGAIFLVTWRFYARAVRSRS